MKLEGLPNPYDFANPVSDEDLFVGRKDELEEIRYYLDHAKTAARPMNLALLGTRASGKTSTLNISEVEGLKRGFCTVRIDLDEDDARSQLAFFMKLFDATLTAVCEMGGFGGTTGKTYDTYVDMVSVPDDKTFCPFLFPLQYARAMGAGNTTLPVFDHNVRHDLLKIRGEVNRPVVLLFDEANVLAQSRVHLEKLRNIFMNTPGFLIVLTGTPDLFPVMDDVFSPIVRQFKKIEVGSFRRRSDTEECIRRPLEKIKLDPADLFDFDDVHGVAEIHDLSGGRPYEIQLICHMLFRRVQAGRAGKMKLDLSVLEDVRRELETSQDTSARPILRSVRALGRRHLEALGALCRSVRIASFEDVWKWEYAFSGNTEWTKDELHSAFEALIRAGILAEREGTIHFEGDEFDRIFVKYFAREQKVMVQVAEIPPEIWWIVRTEKKFEEVEGVEALSGIVGGDESMDLEALARKMCDADNEEDVFVESGGEAEGLYEVLMGHRDETQIRVLRAAASFPTMKGQALTRNRRGAERGPLELLSAELEGIRERVGELGGILRVAEISLPVVNAEVLGGKLERTANERFRTSAGRMHLDRMFKAYVEQRDLEESTFHARAALRCFRDGRIGSQGEPSTANNIGYVLLAGGDRARALELFRVGVEDPPSLARVLARYNQGVVLAAEGDLGGGLECLRTPRRSWLDWQNNERLACSFFGEKAIGLRIPRKERLR